MMVFFGSSVLSHNIESHQIHKLELRFKELLFNLAGNSCEDLPSEQALSVSVPVTASPCLGKKIVDFFFDYSTHVGQHTK